MRVVLFVISGLLIAAAESPAQPAADLVILNAHVWTWTTPNPKRMRLPSAARASVSSISKMPRARKSSAAGLPLTPRPSSRAPGSPEATGITTSSRMASCPPQRSSIGSAPTIRSS